MASIDRTAYPRFKKSVPPQELYDVFTPSPKEIEWAQRATRSDEHLLALVVQLKAFQRLGYFPRMDEVPDAVVGHVRSRLDLAADVECAHDSDRTRRHHRALVRDRQGVNSDREAARVLAEETMRAEARVKDNPADLINVALEELTRNSFELPGFTVLDKMAARVRAEVNYEFFFGITKRMGDDDIARMEGLLQVPAGRRTSPADDLKQSARRPSLSRFKQHLRHLRDLDLLGPTQVWLEEVPKAKVEHFAAEARVLDISQLRKFNDDKRIALVVSLVHVARVRARDEVAGMFCRRMAAIHKKGRERLQEIRERQRAETERLWGVFGRMLSGAREAHAHGEAAAWAESAVCERAGELMLKPLADAGGVAKVSQEHEEISAHHGNNYTGLMAGFYRSHRAALFELLEVLELKPTSADDSVLRAVAFIRANRHLRGEYVPDHLEGCEALDTSFVSEHWAKTIRERGRPGVFVRRQLEVCVFSYLASELRTGDVAVVGADSYASFLDQLMSAEEAQGKIAAYCAEAGIPDTADGLCDMVRGLLDAHAARTDAAYPDNADLAIDEDGVPTLKRRRGRERTASALALEAAVTERMDEVGLLDIVTRTAHWIGWYRHFGPLSGSDPKIKDPLGRYSVIGFTYGTNLGPHQMSRHLRGGLSPHEIAGPAREHVTAHKLNRASADVVNAFSCLDVTYWWGDGSRVGADGTQIDTWDDNLLAETSVRYGGYGGIAYRHIADSYIALFSHFIPCGVWEAVYIFEGLLRQESGLEPETLHADTQGQSLPAFGLAALLGVELLPRIRNWKDLVFYRPSANARYRHIDALFGEDAVINWKLIRTHWIDLMRTVLSIKEGRLSSSVLLRRLSNESKKNRLYRAFRELGRAMRTTVLLRYLNEPELREGITAVTNRVEAFHGFSSWLRFGNNGTLADNDPDHMELLVKFNELLANCVIFYNAVAITAALTQLRNEGHRVYGPDVACLAPYMSAHIRRFGDYVLDVSPPGAAQAHLELDETDQTQESTR
ncbi:MULTISPECIES: Tn3 family transposase [Actinomycetes]|uniref:TnpA family transposase n=2 Tax=Streptosporangiales TaxID=85012 RepID=A0A2T0Q5D1_9ACTN|nr:MULTISPECIES: Tn3 family transposase [Actinomycetes]MCK9874147.1 Tn3 family transposase [Nocardiopsis dassonvillei]NKY96244.1 Tn3 family transposase [Nocardiopsis alborubida]PRX98979.1 TnpA family transposase [Allonocardiopsis opalescens]UCM89784.1 Tn3 family transposase [Streptomyces marincola]